MARNRSKWINILAIIAITLALAHSLGLLLDWPTWVRGSNWVWARRIPDAAGWRWGLLLAVVGCGLLVWRVVSGRQAWARRQLWLLLVWAIIWTPLMQLTIAAQHRVQPLAIAFHAITGPFYEGVQIEDPQAFAQAHFEQMPGYRDVHLRTQPPGWPLVFWAAKEAWGRAPSAADVVGRWFFRYDCLSTDLLAMAPGQLAAGVIPIAIMLLSGLGVLPLYAIGRRLVGKRPSRLAVVAYPFWPGLLVFQGRFDVLYAVLALVVLWLALVAWQDGRGWAALLAGVLIAAGTTFSYGVLAIALLVNCLLLALLLYERQAWRAGLWRLAQLNGWLLLGLVMLWGTIWLRWQIDGLAMFRQGQSIHRTIRLNYPAWPLFNLYDLAVFMGIVLFAGVLLALAATVARKRSDWQPVDALTLGWIAALLALNLSGQVRAETGRLWLLLMGPGILAALAGWQHWLPARRRWQTAVFAAFLLQAVVTGLFLGGRAPQPQAPEPQWRAPATAVAADYTFGDKIALRGYELNQADGALRLTLYWQALDFPREEYAVFTHLLAADSELIAQDDGAPAAGQLPTWCWVPSEIIVDQRVLPLTASGEAIGLGLYDWNSGDRLPVAPALVNDMVRLTVQTGNP